jgi:uncharacterized SAM-binding protein YcdF (DUF218 family)
MVLGFALAPFLGLGVLASCDPPFERTREPGRGEAAVVLSGDVDFYRVGVATRLLCDGRVDWLLMTGAGVGGDSGKVLAEKAIALGAPREKVVVETESTTTRENIVRMEPIIRDRGWKKVLLVTSASHMGRALRTATREMPEIAWIPVPVADPGPWERILANRLHEWLKLAGYVARGWA